MQYLSKQYLSGGWNGKHWHRTVVSERISEITNKLDQSFQKFNTIQEVLKKIKQGLKSDVSELEEIVCSQILFAKTY